MGAGSRWGSAEPSAPLGRPEPSATPGLQESPWTRSARPAVFAHELAARSDVARVVAPNVVLVAHWTRLLDGELYATGPRLDWATLLRRTFDVDVKI